MEQRLAELEAKEHDLQEEQERLRKEMEEVKEALMNERMSTLDSDQRAFYERKLRRVKAYVEAFVAETAYESRGALIESRKSNLKYGFRKREEPYKDDFYEIMADPLDWTIAEYDLLGMEEYVEVRFDYHSEFLKDFVTQWMDENLPHAEPNPLEGLFAFRR
jgi:hypothetical protein